MMFPRIAIFYVLTWFFLMMLDVYFEPTFWVISGSVWALVAAGFVLAKRDIFLGVKGNGREIMHMQFGGNQ